MEYYQTPSLWRRAENCPILHPEAAKDCILPDSYPDIHRILYTFATVNPGRTVFSAGKLQTEGVLYTSVLFADEEGALHTVRFVLDYAGQMPFAAEGGEYTAVSDTVLDSVSARAQNPRKLAIRGRLTVTPYLFVRCDDEPTLASELSGVTLEKKLQTFTCWQLRQWSEEGIEASEDLALGQEPPISEIVWSNLQLEITSCEAGEGEVQFGGNGLLHLFYLTNEGRVQYTNIAFPIRSSVQSDVPAGALCRVMLIPEQVTVLPVEDAAGEARGVELDFTYSVRVAAAWQVSCTRPVDCYSVEIPTAIRTETVDLLSAVTGLSREFDRSVEGESGGLTSILHTAAQMVVDSREQSEEGVVLHCTAQITVLGTNSDGAPLGVQLTENFPLTVDAGELCFCRFDCLAQPAAVLEENTLKVRLVGKISGFAMETGAVSYVGSVLPSEGQLPSDADSITLCYPAPGETLWDIAKRYRIPQSAILSANSVPEGTLPAVLLIPH
ncbi:MAG: LysM peptidoglycan-binding domain-containing protein [Clostridia bacterium]|nr:LysM peptidoglycan-binding domain-containing protein [Clostridia bacterium]